MWSGDLQHIFDETLLRENDVRGIVGRTLCAGDAFVLGRAFGSVARRRGAASVAVGYDGRPSSPELAEGLALLHFLAVGHYRKENPMPAPGYQWPAGSSFTKRKRRPRSSEKRARASVTWELSLRMKAPSASFDSTHSYSRCS